MEHYLLTILIFLPLVGAGGGLLIPARHIRFFRLLNLSITLIQLVALFVILAHVRGNATLQLAEHRTWFEVDLGDLGQLQAAYFVGVDGLSLPMVALTIVVMTIVGVSSWTIGKNQKGYFVLLLTLNGAILGTFCALDFLLFYLFFEFMLLPMYFLIGIWGGPRREYASIKFLLYTLSGSILILVVLIGLYTSVKSPLSGDSIVHTFNMVDMSNPANIIDHSIFSQAGARKWGFVLLLVGFLIKLPSVPFHTWLPDAHVEAPTPISVALAALLLKIGGYGIMRLAYPIFPDAALSLSWLVGILAVVSIIYGALNALASKDLKRLIAYSSVSHMGFVLLGVASMTTLALSGAVYQMVSHGLISTLLFLAAGVLYDRTQDRSIGNYSGLSSRMPGYFGVVLISFFASMGLPGFSGFIAEIMVLLGAFQSSDANGLLSEGFALVAVSGLILGAGYYLWTLQRMFFGPFRYAGQSSADSLGPLMAREYLMFIPLIILVLALGLFPQPLLDYINPFASSFVKNIFDHAREARLQFN